MSTAIPCPDRDEFRRLVEGLLPADHVHRLAAHFERCEPCARVVRELQARDTPAADLFPGDGRSTNAAESEESKIRGFLARIEALAIGTSSPATNVTRLSDEGLAGLLAPPEWPDEIGRLGGYRVLRKIAEGGMGVVLLAEDPQLMRKAALKIMKPQWASKQVGKERFLREARAAALIASDHVVTIYHVGEDRGVPFLAMQWLEGETLEDRLEREGALPYESVLRVSRQTALGLAAAHDKGILHRDIKPGNIWLESNDNLSPPIRVKLLDFGLARPIVEDARLTATGEILGTPAYMAPERFAGRPLDFRADLFSLGVVLYRASVGEPPFTAGDLVATIRAICDEQPAPPDERRNDLPAAFGRVVMRLLEKRPEDRFPSAQAVIAAIDGLQTPQQ